MRHLPPTLDEFISSQIQYARTSGQIKTPRKYKSRNIQTSEDGYKTSGRIQWEQDSATFSKMGEGERNSTLVNLALRGRSLEITGNFAEGETLDRLINDCESNGYLYDEGESKTYQQIQTMREIADLNHSDELAYGSSKYIDGRGLYSSTTLDSLPTDTPLSLDKLYQLNHWLKEVELSTMSPGAKRQHHVAAAMYRATGDPTVILSQRASIAAAKVTSRRVTDNWLAGEKLGFTSVDRGISFDDVDGEDKSKARSATITLNVDVMPTTRLQSPVAISTLQSMVNTVKGYVKYRRRQIRQEKQDYLRSNDISTIGEPLDTLVPPSLLESQTLSSPDAPPSDPKPAESRENLHHEVNQMLRQPCSTTCKICYPPKEPPEPINRNQLLADLKKLGIE